MKYTEFYKNITKMVEKNKIFFFHGDNTYFMLNTVDRIKDVLKTDREFLYCWEIEVEEVIKRTTTLSLFIQKNVIVLRHFELAKKGFKKNLVEFVKNYNGQNLLLILYEQKILTKDLNDESIMWLLDNCVNVDFDSLTKEEIINSFIPEKTKFEFTEGALEILLEHTGNDLWLLSNELDKLTYFAEGKKQIDEEDVSKCIAQYETAETKELSKNIVCNNFQKSLSLLNLLLNIKKMSEVSILYSLYKFFKKDFVYKKLPQQKVYKLLKELQNTDLKLKTKTQKKYILEGCILRLMKIYNE